MFEQWFNSLDEYTIGALGMFIIMTYFIFIGWLMYGDPCSIKKNENES